MKVKLDRVIIRFIGLFFLLVLILSLVVKASWVEIQLINPYTAFLARTSAGILAFFGTQVQVMGSTLGKDTFFIEIRRGCDGLEATVLLVAAILAYPSTWRGRVAGAIGGFALIFALNFIRIVGLCLIGFRAAGEGFEFVHVYVSQFAVIAFTMVFWVYWAGKQKPLRA